MHEFAADTQTHTEMHSPDAAAAPLPLEREVLDARGVQAAAEQQQQPDAAVSRAEQSGAAPRDGSPKEKEEKEEMESSTAKASSNNASERTAAAAASDASSSVARTPSLSSVSAAARKAAESASAGRARPHERFTKPLLVYLNPRAGAKRGINLFKHTIATSLAEADVRYELFITGITNAPPARSILI